MQLLWTESEHESSSEFSRDAVHYTSWDQYGNLDEATLNKAAEDMVKHSYFARNQYTPAVNDVYRWNGRETGEIEHSKKHKGAWLMFLVCFWPCGLGGLEFSQRLPLCVS